MELPFAGLHQLCAPMLDRLDALPAPQQRRAARRLRAARPATRRTASWSASPCSACWPRSRRSGRCCASSTTRSGSTTPPRQVLAFVARRLLAESVAMVFAVREPSERARAGGAARAARSQGSTTTTRARCCATVIPGRLDERVRDRIVAETRGNPLALLELPRGLSAAELAGGFGLPDAAAAVGPDRGELPAAARASCRTRRGCCCWSPRRNRSAIRRCCGARPTRLGIAGHALEPPAPSRAAGRRRAGALSPPARALGGLPMRPPTSSAGSVHGALAEVTDAAAEPDRRAWHRAQATPAPTRRSRPSSSAPPDRAQARGGLAAAAAFLERAAALTPDPARRARAHAGRGAGQPAGRRVRRRARPAGRGAGRAAGRARAARASDLLRAEVAFAQSRGSDAPPLLLARRARSSRSTPRLARDDLSGCAGARRCSRAGSRAPAACCDVSRAARAAPQADGAPRPATCCWTASRSLFTDGRAAAAPLLQQRGDGVRRPRASVEEVAALGLAGDGGGRVRSGTTTRAWRARRARGPARARRRARSRSLAVALNVLGQAVSLRRRLREGGARWSPRPTRSPRRRGPASRRTARWCSPACRGQRSRGRRADRRPRSRTPAPAARARRVQYAHWAHAVLLNGSAATRRRSPRPRAASDDTPELFVAAGR